MSSVDALVDFEEAGGVGYELQHYNSKQLTRPFFLSRPSSRSIRILGEFLECTMFTTFTSGAYPSGSLP